MIITKSKIHFELTPFQFYFVIFAAIMTGVSIAMTIDALLLSPEIKVGTVVPPICNTFVFGMVIFTFMKKTKIPNKAIERYEKKAGEIE